jgi:hypothetical protein
MDFTEENNFVTYTTKNTRKWQMIPAENEKER